MSKLFTYLAVVFLCCSCISDEYKFRVYGQVNTNEGLKDAVWYCDTFYYVNESIYYINSDSSIVWINKPFVIEKIN